MENTEMFLSRYFTLNNVINHPNKLEWKKTAAANRDDFICQVGTLITSWHILKGYILLNLLETHFQIVLNKLW